MCVGGGVDVCGCECVCGECVCGFGGSVINSSYLYCFSLVNRLSYDKSVA